MGCNCPRHSVSRRGFLRTVGMGGLMLAPGVGLSIPGFGFLPQDRGRTRLRGSSRRGRGGRARSVILLWMQGGPSQLDTFDPKPGHENGGPVRAIETAVKGISIAGSLPTVAGQMDKLSVLRGVVTGEPEHFRAQYLMHTGVKFLPSFPHPSMGAVISYELSGSLDTPGYVSIGAKSFGPTFLGYEHAPFVIDRPGSALRMLRETARRRTALDFAEELSRKFDEERGGVNVKKRDSFYERIRKILDSPFSRALDLGQEPNELREAYGRNGFGEGCLLARRLVEAGVRFVEVHLGGWDTHQNNYKRTRRLTGRLDPAFGTLVRDLHEKGLLNETIVLWMGEFGRTPKINKDRGRDHWANGFSVVLGGGGIHGGRLIGETDDSGMNIRRDPVAVPHIFATVYSLLGIDPGKKYYSPRGSLVKATEGGRPIRALIS